MIRYLTNSYNNISDETTSINWIPTEGVIDMHLSSKHIEALNHATKERKIKEVLEWERIRDEKLKESRKRG